VADPVTRGAAKLAALIALPIAVLVGLLAFWQLGGFDRDEKPNSSATPGVGATSVVSMPVPSLAPADATMCLAFIAQLPDKLGNLPQRPVTAGGNQQNAAYGDPPVKVSCGAPAASVPAGSTVYMVGKVCWYADDSNPQVNTWTTVDRQVPIRVELPKAYEGQLVQEFSSPIVASVISLPEAQLPSACTNGTAVPSPTTS
jgi:Protein of unknown function (DUF3515)